MKHAGRTWQVRLVHGELSLRRALLDGTALIAVLPEGYDPALDLSERGYRRRVLSVEAQDIVAAASGRFSVRIRDELLARAILDAPDVLASSSGAWTLGPSKTTVTEDEVRSVLLAKALGFVHKLERHAPEALLARWLVSRPQKTDLSDLVAEQLKRTFGIEGEWLAQALEPEGLRRVVAAGALAATPRGRRAAEAVLDVVGDREWGRLRTLVERAVRSAGVERLSDDAQQGLSDAEARFHRLRAKAEGAVRFPLLRGALEATLSDLMNRCAAGQPPPSELVEAAGRSLHRAPLSAAVELTATCARLARFSVVAKTWRPESIDEWFDLACGHAAWADFLARRMRRLQADVSQDLSEAAGLVSAEYLELRDQWNHRFAQRLIEVETSVYSARDRRRPVSLSDVSRVLLRPLFEADKRVFLLVLDGCDLSTFIELLRGWSLETPIGLVLPSVGGQIGDDLVETGAFLTGVSPLPTLTAHARRALFAGELPKNPILDERDAVAANASADHRAFKENITLGDIPGACC